MLNLTDDINLKWGDKYATILVATTNRKNIEKLYKDNNVKEIIRQRIKNLNHIMDHIVHQIIKIVWVYFEYQTLTDNLLIQIYINKIENRITCIIKSEYYFVLLTSETMKLLESKEKR